MRKLAFLLLSLMIISLFYMLPRNIEGRPWTVPHLPRPVAEKRVLVTSAGQSTDGLITARMMKDLHLSYSYRRKAGGEDFSQWFNSLVLTLGHSQIGLNKVSMSFEEEMDRVQSLLETVHREGGSTVVVHVGGRSRRGGKHDLLIKRFAPQANYIIVVQGGNYDNLFGKIAAENGIPLTICRDIDNVKPPLNSAYR